MEVDQLKMILMGQKVWLPNDKNCIFRSFTKLSVGLADDWLGPDLEPFFCRPTSDVNISKTVYPIDLKIKVQKVPTSHSSYINFQVNRINHFRDIDVGRNQLGLSMDIEPKVVQHVSSPKESNLTT